MERDVLDMRGFSSEEGLRDALSGFSAFERDVYLATFKIPRGKVTTYSAIARKLGRPNAARAVANALRKCPFYPEIPAHRVVRADGSITGNERDAAARRLRLREEGIEIRNGKVKMTSEVIFL